MNGSPDNTQGWDAFPVGEQNHSLDKRKKLFSRDKTCCWVGSGVVRGFHLLQTKSITLKRHKTAEKTEEDCKRDKSLREGSSELSQRKRRASGLNENLSEGWIGIVNSRGFGDSFYALRKYFSIVKSRVPRPGSGADADFKAHDLEITEISLGVPSERAKIIKRGGDVTLWWKSFVKA